MAVLVSRNEEFCGRSVVVIRNNGILFICPFDREDSKEKPRSNNTAHPGEQDNVLNGNSGEHKG